MKHAFWDQIDPVKMEIDNLWNSRLALFFSIFTIDVATVGMLHIAFSNQFVINIGWFLCLGSGSVIRKMTWRIKETDEDMSIMSPSEIHNAVTFREFPPQSSDFPHHLPFKHLPFWFLFVIVSFVTFSIPLYFPSYQLCLFLHTKTESYLFFIVKSKNLE